MRARNRRWVLLFFVREQGKCHDACRGHSQGSGVDEIESAEIVEVAAGKPKASQVMLHDLFMCSFRMLAFCGWKQ